MSICWPAPTPLSPMRSPPDQASCGLTPAGYVETQGAFAERPAREIGPRTGLDCRVTLAAHQTDFSRASGAPQYRPRRSSRLERIRRLDAIADYYAT
jgi:hypothetical protein